MFKGATGVTLACGINNECCGKIGVADTRFPRECCRSVARAGDSQQGKLMVSTT